jgi:hypothetical protein
MTRFCCDPPVYADDIKAVKVGKALKSADAAHGPATPTVWLHWPGGGGLYSGGTRHHYSSRRSGIGLHLLSIADVFGRFSCQIGIKSLAHIGGLGAIGHASSRLSIH